jgi:hypothetical protein
MSSSQGDPRVLFAMNVVLSTLFAAAVVFGLDFIGVLSFGPVTVGLAAAALVVLTHLVTS